MGQPASGFPIGQIVILWSQKTNTSATIRLQLKLSKNFLFPPWSISSAMLCVPWTKSMICAKLVFGFSAYYMVRGRCWVSAFRSFNPNSKHSVTSWWFAISAINAELFVIFLHSTSIFCFVLSKAIAFIPRSFCSTSMKSGKKRMEAVETMEMRWTALLVFLFLMVNVIKTRCSYLAPAGSGERTRKTTRKTPLHGRCSDHLPMWLRDKQSHRRLWISKLLFSKNPTYGIPKIRFCLFSFLALLIEISWCLIGFVPLTIVCQYSIPR